MASEAMEAANGAAKGGDVIWSSYSNWIPVYGSLEESVSLETSDLDASPPASCGLLLRRPPGDDSSPCEITVCFRVKHEIHRVYVRSAARVYEIYYATDQENTSKNYLCTVSCDLAIKEVLPSSGKVSTAEGENCSCGTVEKHEHTDRSDSSHSGEEGWVDLKTPDSPSSYNLDNSLSRKADGTFSSNFQMHYEATTETAGVGPCVSLTVRFLAFGRKTSVHIEGICIYADPVDSTNQNPSVTRTGSAGESSLLAMLAPNLLQSSKFRTSRIHDNYFSELRVQNSQCCLTTANSSSSSAARLRTEQTHTGTKLGPLQEEGSMKQDNIHLESNQKVTDQEANSSTSDHCVDQMQEATQVNPNNMQLGSHQKLEDLGKTSNSVIQEKDIAQNRLEKVLNDLVNKVDKIEAFCSRFEENMMKPLNGIETRLQQLEQQFDSFTEEIHSSKRNPCLQISAPEFQFFKSCLQNNGCSSCTGRKNDALHSPSISCDKIFLNLVDKAPNIADEDSCGSPLQVDHVPDIVPESQRIDALAIKAPVLPDENNCPTASLEEHNRCPGLVLEVPQNCNEDKYANCVLNLDSRATDNSRYISPSSIDDALASALEAFCTSNMSDKAKPNTEISNKIFYDNDYGLDSTFLPEGADNLADRSYFDRYIYSISDEMEKEATFGTSMSYAGTDPDPSPDEPDLVNKGGDKSDVSEDGAAFDSSPSADYLNSMLSPTRICSGFIVSVPEFPKADDFIDYSNDSDSDVPFCLKDQEFVPTNTGLVSALAAFLTTRNVNSSNHSSTMREPFGGAKIEPSAHGLSYEEVSNDTEIHGNTRIGKVDWSHNLQFLLPNGRSEYEEHEKRSIEATAARSTNCPDNEHSFNQIEAITAKQQLLIRYLLNSADIGSPKGIKNMSGDSLDDSDIKEAANDSSRLTLGRGWMEESNTSLSLLENTTKSEVQIYWSSKSSRDSLMGASIHADDINGKAQLSVETTMHQGDSTTGIGLLSTDCGEERSPEELQHAFNSIFIYGNSIVDVNDAQEQKGCDFPLELFLGKTSDAHVLDPIVSAGPSNLSSSLRTSSSNVHENIIDVDVLPATSKAYGLPV
ncbi:uncharacterized protein [Typha angustifolia]|uniref:uncharacterized protein n=1 Tax=Typha angustifolia TaxID=59011 RepID=UPI003C2EDFF0